VCQAVRAPGSNLTNAAPTCDGPSGSNSRVIVAVPVKYSAGPRLGFWVPLRLISICSAPALMDYFAVVPTAAIIFQLPKAGSY